MSDRKRARSIADASVVDLPSSTALRAALAARCGDDSPAGAWKSAAAAAGVSGADAFLCHLGRAIVAEIQSLPAKAEAARAKLRSTRETLLSAINSRFDELEQRVTTAETSKITALERELCDIDATLEKLRAERSVVSEAVASLDDAELTARHAELSARLEDAEAQLLAQSTAIVDPPHIELAGDSSALLIGIATFGRVVAPRAVTAADLILESTPSSAQPGATLQCRIVLHNSQHASRSAEELAVSLAAAAAAVQVEASVVTLGAAPLPLQAEVNADLPGRGLVVSIVVPHIAPVGSSVCFGPLTVSGQPVAGLLRALRVEPSPYSAPTDLSPEHAAWLQLQLPPGGSHSPDRWKEVYRGTTHGFGAAVFHARCDGRARLLVLVRAREGGWLFGGFTAVGFSIPEWRYISDPAAFLFSLTNSLGRPEKLRPLGGTGSLFYDPSRGPAFGNSFPSDLDICDNADTEADSHTVTGNAYAESASTGTHPMAKGNQRGWTAAEIVAWVV